MIDGCDVALLESLTAKQDGNHSKSPPSNDALSAVISVSSVLSWHPIVDFAGESCSFPYVKQPLFVLLATFIVPQPSASRDIDSSTYSRSLHAKTTTPVGVAQG